MPYLNESLVVVFLIGLLTAWVPVNLLPTTSLGIAGDLVAGVVGAFAGHWVLPQIHSHSLLSLVFTSMIGATILLLIVRAVPFVRSLVNGSEDRVRREFERR